MAPTAQQQQQREEEFHFVPSSSSATSESATKAGQPELGTPLRMICDEQREFELNLGKAVDTLKHDYPYILTEHPGT
jgi:hypothetical protein